MVKLPDYDSLVGPNDTARSKFFQAQLKSTYTISDTASIVNLAYWGLEHSNKYETYGYDEWVPRNLNLQDRTEFHDQFNIGPIANSLITGIDLRYQYVRSGDDYSSEPFSYYDLSLPLNNIFYPGYALENNSWGSGLEVAGHPGYSYQEMQDTHDPGLCCVRPGRREVHQGLFRNPRLPRGRDQAPTPPIRPSCRTASTSMTTPRASTDPSRTTPTTGITRSRRRSITTAAPFTRTRPRRTTLRTSSAWSTS